MALRGAACSPTGGRFLTQQRSEAGGGGGAWEDLFDRPFAPRVFDLAFAVSHLRDAGFGIAHAEEAQTPMVFTDLAGVIYYLRLVPWAVEGFDPGEDRKALQKLADRVATDGELRIRGACMLVDATVPG